MDQNHTRRWSRKEFWNNLPHPLSIPVRRSQVSHYFIVLICHFQVPRFAISNLHVHVGYIWGGIILIIRPLTYKECVNFFTTNLLGRLTPELDLDYRLTPGSPKSLLYRCHDNSSTDISSTTLRLQTFRLPTFRLLWLTLLKKKLEWWNENYANRSWINARNSP